MAGIFNYNRVYQAYSGCDMVAHINHVPVGSLQAVTVSITREVVPIYTMGSADVKTFVKGKRGIAGTLSFSTFDRHALLYDVFNNAATPIDWFKNIGSLSDAYKNYGTSSYSTNALGESQMIDGQFTADTSRRYTGQDSAEVNKVVDAYGQRKLRYSDELPPFNITLTMVNDFGAASTCHINGVVLINEGYGYTMDDLTNDISFTYVAREVTPLEALSSNMFSAPAAG